MPQAFQSWTIAFSNFQPIISILISTYTTKKIMNFQIKFTHRAKEKPKIYLLLQLQFIVIKMNQIKKINYKAQD